MDIRSQKTRKNISDCFIALLNEKPAAKITVTEICDMAGINRATFYKHYLDIPDLQEKLEQELLNEFSTFLKESVGSSNIQYRDLLVRMLAYTRELGDTFYTLCSPNAASEFVSKWFLMVNETAFPLLMERIPNIQEALGRHLYWYISSGSGNLLVRWFSGESEMTVDEIVDFMMLVTGASVRAILENGET